ncbi:MAG: hypothetical protein FJ098_13590 [Deltaproteobacteria bacterium]|nr:hypothetical protein [Deltaproteobacteria bacterium]
MARILLLLSLLASSPAASEEPRAPGGPDAFAATLRAAGALSGKARAYTLERVATAWARGDLCGRALEALRAAGDAVDPGRSLEIAVMCAETGTDDDARRLLTLARGRILQCRDPLERGLHLAALAGVFQCMDQLDERDAAAQAAWEALPATCDPLVEVQQRTALARRFATVDLAPWAAHLLAGAARVAADLPGRPSAGAGWNRDLDHRRALTDAAGAHLALLGGEAGESRPRPPLQGCEGKDLSVSRDHRVADRAMATAAVAATLDALGDPETGALGRKLAAALVLAMESPEERDRAVRWIGPLLAREASGAAATGFLAAVADTVPGAAREVFLRLARSQDLPMPPRAGPTSISMALDLARTLAPPKGRERHRFRRAAARWFLLGKAPLEAWDLVLSEGDPFDPLALKVLEDAVPMNPQRAADTAASLPDAWRAAALFRVAAARTRLGDAEGGRETREAALAAMPPKLRPERGHVEALLARGDADRDHPEGATEADLLARAGELADGVRPERDRTRLLDRIARRWVRAGSEAQALAVALRMSRGVERDRLLGFMALRHLDAGRTREALSLLPRIRSDGRRIRALAEVALHLVKASETLPPDAAKLLDALAP